MSIVKNFLPVIFKLQNLCEVCLSMGSYTTPWSAGPPRLFLQWGILMGGITFDKVTLVILFYELFKLEK